MLLNCSFLCSVLSVFGICWQMNWQPKVCKMLFFVCFTNICFKVYFVCYQYSHSYCFLGTVYMVSLFPFFYFKLICAFESKIILLKIMCSWAIPFFFVNLTSLCLYWRVQSIHIQCSYSSGRIYMCILLSVFPMSYVLLFFCFYITAFICFKSIFSTVPFQFPVVSFAIYFGVFFFSSFYGDYH